MSKKLTRTFMLDKRNWEKLKRFAEVNDTSMSEILDTLIDQNIPREVDKGDNVQGNVKKP